MSNIFAGLIGALSATIGHTLEIAKETTVHADFDDFALLIEFFPASGQVLLAVPVADVPPASETGGGRESLYRELLQGHYLFAGTHGAALALDPEGRFVCLQLLQHINALTRDNFPVLVENFLNQAEEWRRRCLAAGEAAPEPPAAEPGQGMIRV
jgi:hypothetical protein